MANEIIKKSIHFNYNNDEDKKILDYIAKQSINFSALMKNILMNYVEDQVFSKSEIKNIVKKEVEDIISSRISELAIEGQIRKVIQEILSQNTEKILRDMPVKNSEEESIEDVVDNIKISVSDLDNF